MRPVPGYAMDPSFEILLIAWSTDTGAGFKGKHSVLTLPVNDPFPEELLEALFQSGRCADDRA